MHRLINRFITILIAAALTGCAAAPHFEIGQRNNPSGKKDCTYGPVMSKKQRKAMGYN